jgi:hypothetical protein
MNHEHSHTASHGTEHRHDQSHGHGHHHHHEAAEARAQPVVLDLGGDIGALVVYTDPELLGVEIELSPAGADEERRHKQVLSRLLGPVTATVLVYDNLPQGDYTLWVDETDPIRGIRVAGGEVAELDRRHAREPALPPR